MKIVIQKQEELELVPCKCGCSPEFIRPQAEYTDIWLECPICGKRTCNTGGFYYAMEIPLEVAKRNAVIDWNNRKFVD